MARRPLKNIRVVVSDDHPIVRYALRAILSLEGEIEVVGDSEVGPNVLQLVTEVEADIVLLDLSTSYSGTSLLVQKLRNSITAPRLISLTASEDKNQLVHALQLGCSGIVLKQATTAEIVKCIRKVYAGETWLDPRISTAARFELTTSKDKVHSVTRRTRSVVLSGREQEILTLIAQSYTNPQIAARFGLSVHTVKNHLHNLYEKTGLTTRAELVIHTIQYGIHIGNTH